MSSKISQGLYFKIDCKTCGISSFENALVTVFVDLTVSYTYVDVIASLNFYLYDKYCVNFEKLYFHPTEVPY